MTARVAVYGGSFSPFGNHHRDVVHHVAECGEFDEVLVVPTVAHPLKKQQFPYEHRLNMAELAVRDEEWEVPVGVSDVERIMLRDNFTAPLFTITVLRALKRYSIQYNEHESAKYRFIIGPDIREELGQWKNVEDIRREFGFFEAPDMGVHSTEIRQIMADGFPGWKDHVPTLVAGYIETHGLYGVEQVTGDLPT